MCNVRGEGDPDSMSLGFKREGSGGESEEKRSDLVARRVEKGQKWWSSEEKFRRTLVGLGLVPKTCVGAEEPLPSLCLPMTGGYGRDRPGG